MLRALGRGTRRGLGYGLAVACVESAFGGWRLVQVHMTPAAGFAARAALAEVALGAALGAAAAPLLARGWFLHLVAMAAAWAALAVWAASGDATLPVLAGPAAGLVLAVAARAVGRRRPWLPPALGAGVLAAALVVPGAYIRYTTPPSPPLPALPPPPANAPDVVVVVLDTVRADHVSAYGYARPTTPTIDALAREGALFLDATAPATWSLPSHASLFTGLFPSGHGAHDEHHFLDPGPPTLGETLAAAGWDTRCFTANAWISDGLGLTRGFRWQDEAWRAGAVARSFHFVYRLADRLGFGATDKGGADVAANFERWAAARPAADRPAYAFLNFIEAHFPYHQVPADYLARFTQRTPGELRALSMRLQAAQFGADAPDAATAAAPATAMYDAGILYADHLLGRVVEALRRRGSFDRTVLVVLADHGELLGEHGRFGHGFAPYEPLVRVPLLVRYPPRIPAGARVAAPVSTVGVYATVLDLVGVVPRAPLHVGSLVPVVEGRFGGRPALAERFAARLVRGSEAAAGDPLGRSDVRYRTYSAGTWKLVVVSDGRRHLFDRAAEPSDTDDRAASSRSTAARLAAELGAWQEALGLPALDAPVGRAAPPAPDPAARERLRALGYVE